LIKFEKYQNFPFPKVTRGMTRGNQRDLARERRQKKDTKKSKGTELTEGVSLAQKKASYLILLISLRDAEIMRQKQIHSTNKSSNN
jgi:4F5 protein related disordered region